MQLSKEQQAIAEAIDGQILVVACPGSGKTTALIERAVNMVRSGIAPDSMLNITFTKAAAQEMEHRFQVRYGESEGAASLRFSTIHAFCYRLLCQKYGYSQNDIFKESEKWTFIKSRLGGRIAGSRMDDCVAEVMQGIGFIKNRELEASSFRPEKVRQEVFESIFNAYEEYRKSVNKIDFDDMILLFRDKLKTDGAFLNYCRERYQYVSVDEFQDVNKIQAEICYNIAGPDGNLFVVGDDDQSIYRFRGAAPGIMLSFPKQFPKCRTFQLRTNYRSGQDIVKMSGKMIMHNKRRFEKEFLAASKESGDVYVLKNETATIQARQIIREAQDLRRSGVPYEKMAVLYRNNSLSLPLVNAMIRVDIPFHITDNTSSIHTDPIYQDVVAYWNLSQGSGRPGDLQRILNHPSRYLPAAPFRDAFFNKENLMQAAEKTGKEYAKARVQDLLWDVQMFKRQETPRRFMDYLINSMNYQKWLEENAEFLGVDPADSITVLDALRMEARGFETMEDWFDYVAEYEIKLYQASKKDRKNGITLSTFHSAKGLEWDTVFAVNINEDVVPYSKATSKEDMEEERRAFYVAATRAKNRLYLSYLTGSSKEYLPSRFLYEMGIHVK